MQKPMFVVSACLCGECCRYDGTCKTLPQVQQLVHEGAAIAVCPEVLGGLNIPREPAQIRNGRVITQSGKDVTSAYLQGAQKTLRITREIGVTQAILKEKSPSCGAHFVYDGTFSGRLIEGQGITAHLLAQNGIKVFSEEDYLRTQNT